MPTDPPRREGREKGGVNMKRDRREHRKKTEAAKPAGGKTTARSPGGHGFLASIGAFVDRKLESLVCTAYDFNENDWE